MFTLIRIDTENYGWIISQHKTLDSADAAYARKLKKLPPNALGHLMYRVTEHVAGKTGTRVRIPAWKRSEGFTRAMLNKIMKDLALSTLDFDDEGNGALTSDEAIPRPLAQQAQARIEGAGGEASWAPDNDDRELAWLYVTVSE